MFLPFIKKNSTELDLIFKIKNKYKDLPLSSVLGLVYCFFEFGKDNLEKEIAKFLEDQDTTKAVENYVMQTVPHIVNLEFDLESIRDFAELIYIRDELYEKYEPNDLIYFACVIARNDDSSFQTNVSDIVDVTKHPDVSVIRTILNRDDVLLQIQNHVRLTNTNHDELVVFTSRKDLEVELIKLYINDPDQKKTYCLSYHPEQADKNNPRHYNDAADAAAYASQAYANAASDPNYENDPNYNPGAPAHERETD